MQQRLCGDDQGEKVKHRGSVITGERFIRSRGGKEILDFWRLLALAPCQQDFCGQVCIGDGAGFQAAGILLHRGGKDGDAQAFSAIVTAVRLSSQDK